MNQQSILGPPLVHVASGDGNKRPEREKEKKEKRRKEEERPAITPVAMQFIEEEGASGYCMCSTDGSIDWEARVGWIAEWGL